MRAAHHAAAAGAGGGRARLSLRDQHRADEGRHPDPPLHRGRPVQRQPLRHLRPVRQGRCSTGKTFKLQNCHNTFSKCRHLNVTFSV